MCILHFISNMSEGPQKQLKIYPIIGHLNLKFQMLYLPQQGISIDELLTL